MPESTHAERRRRVLVLGEDARAFLTVIRSLGRKGIEVHVGWCPPKALSLRSRYISKIHTLPAYSMEDDSWKRELIALVGREQFDLVIPCNDQTMIPLQKHREELAAHARFYTLSPEVFSVAFNKIQTNKLGRELGLKLPRETLVERVDDAQRVIADGFAFPLVLKPEASFVEHDLDARNEVKRVHDSNALQSALENMLLRNRRVIVQELFIGVGCGVELLAMDGTILVALQHMRVHEPLTGGASSYRKTVPLDPELYEAAEKLMRALNYTGVAMVEFKVNPETGDWILIEINGRFWGSLPLAVAAGVDFPFYLFEMLVCGRSEFPRSYRSNVFCRNTYQDLNWLPANFKADKSDPTLRTLSLRRVAGEIFNIIALRERNDTFVVDDPMPAFAELGLIFRIALARLSGAVSLLLLSLPPVRRFLTGQIHRRMRTARSILFVCHGNICRSPFAEGYAKVILGEDRFRIASTGYFPKIGRVSPESARAAGNSFGLDLSRHRSSCLDSDMIADADIIFIFDRDNWVNLLRRYPEARRKTYYVGLLTPQGPIAIEDPYGKSAVEFERCYRAIARSLNALRSAVCEKVPLTQRPAAGARTADS